MFFRKCLSLACSAWVLTSGVRAQLAVQPMPAAVTQAGPHAAALPEFRPNRNEMLARYKQAAVMDSVVKNTAFKTSILPNWQSDGERFWYRNVLKDSTFEYWLVDPAKAGKKPAIDQARLAAA